MKALWEMEAKAREKETEAFFNDLVLNRDQYDEQDTIQHVAAPERSANELRPVTFNDIVGQDHTKQILGRMVETAKRRGKPFDHVLLVGASGTGKTTFAHVIAHELGARVFQLEAPVSTDTLLELATTMKDGDILFLDEIHQQSLGDRRGRSSSTQPEVLFSIMEDRTMPTATGIIQFPHVTIMGATTDEGMLPDAFINRFPIRPRLEKYDVDEMTLIAVRNAHALGLKITFEAALMLGRASRSTPREVNNFIRNAKMLSDEWVDEDLAREVLFDLNGVTIDGLTRDMQQMMLFLLEKSRRESKDGEVRYQASVNTIATAIGKSRDSKAVSLRVEPYLIEQGWVQVAHGGRLLTDLGVERARELQRGS